MTATIPRWSRLLGGIRGVGPLAKFASRLCVVVVAAVVLRGAIAQALEPARGGTDGTGAKPSSRPNVILISLDTLRADRLSLYGYERETSPALKQLASESVVFDRFFYSGGGTLPSHMSMLTSLNPTTHGLTVDNEKSLEAERTTLAEVLRDAGYRTAAFVDGGWMGAKFGFGQGFEIYDDSGGHFAAILPKARQWLSQFRLPAPGAKGRKRGVGNASPYFLFLHTYDIHSAWTALPYDCPGDAELNFVKTAPSSFSGCRDGLCASRYFASVVERVAAGGATRADLLSDEELRFASDLYDGCIRYVDGELAKLLMWLRKTTAWEKTILIVTSDHGEEFGEHGSLLHGQQGYDEVARIPLLLKLDGRRFAGTRVRSLAAMIDLMPTLLQSVGLPIPVDAQGVSQLSAIERGAPVRTELHMLSTLRTDRVKYFGVGKRLFDLGQDPGERRNLWTERPAEVHDLASRLAGHLERDRIAAAAFSSTTGRAPAAKLEPAEIERLRALGYLR